MKNLAAALAALPALTRAHEGHGIAGTHWHATDVLGFVVIGAVALAAWWGMRK